MWLGLYGVVATLVSSSPVEDNFSGMYGPQSREDSVVLWEDMGAIHST